MHRHIFDKMKLLLNLYNSRLDLFTMEKKAILVHDLIQCLTTMIGYECKGMGYMPCSCTQLGI